ncbi:MAG: lipid-transfer protein [Pseudomonadales bacterium]|nr:lipid-transfer protein [Pseudomonadales bacterium]MBP9032950.1 lipid-transfer protein [Pseudomonadales bacterium]
MSDNKFLSGKTAVVGLGATEFSKDSGRSEIQLGVEAISMALADAGLSIDEVDGMASYTMDNNPEIELYRLLGGKELKFFSRTHYGGGAACGPLLHAAMAVATGVCKAVVVYRAMNERSGFRFGQGGLISTDPNSFETVHFGWYMPFGLSTPASWVAMCAKRYLHTWGAEPDDFGRVAVSTRDFAATNPAAFFHGKPITLEDYRKSRWIAEPLRLFDCCQESDGAVAMVITSIDRARDLRQKPVVIRGAAQGAAGDFQMMTGFYRPDLTAIPEMGLVARQLYDMAGVGPQDIQTAVLYDHFTPFVLPQLEEFGFCGRGEAKDFIRAGHIGRGGKLPVNTHGGQIGEAYIHGLNGVAEGVRQVRGTAVNQTPGVEHALVTAGTGVPTSGVILGADR